MKGMNKVRGTGQPMRKGGYRNPSDGKNEMPDQSHADLKKRASRSGGGKQMDMNKGPVSPIAKNEM